MAANSGWNKLHDRYYRKFDVYDMLWVDIEMEKYVIAGAQYGGPIAMVRDERKVLLLGYTDDSGLKPKMRIFTSAGKLISSFTWVYKGLVGMSWNDKEQLVCVLDDGTVHVYSVHGEKLRTLSLGQACKADGVAEVKFWGSGLVVRTGGKSELFTIADYEKGTVKQLADAGLTQPPTSMAVIPPHFNASGNPEVLLATSKGSIVVVDHREAQDQLLTNGPFNKMVVSPSGRVVACFTDDGTLYVMATDFSQNLSRFGTNSKVPPKYLVWCGDDSVILYWDNIKILLMVGPYGDFVKYAYEGALFLVTECDGVRVVTDKKCEFLQCVPESTEAIFTIGSTTPAALLYDAAESFEHQNVKAAENIRLINEKGDLQQAIDHTLNAAAHEFHHNTQKILLKAASFGKLHCSDYKADNFVDMCKILRVLNAVRDPQVGIPLTFQQYHKLEADVLVDRLINRHNHLLALRICNYLRIKAERVLVHWACAKIKSSTEEEDTALGQLIVDKLLAAPGISFSQIATTAFEEGRRNLAVMLLEYEPHASDQVPLLISMKEDELALNKAIDSGDTDLVYLCLLHMKRTMDFKGFFALIASKPLARALYVSYCKQHDLAALKTFFYHLAKPVEAANVAVLEAYMCKNNADRNTGLDIALEFYQKDKTNTTPAQATQEQIELLKEEQKCELESKGSSHADYMDSSVSELLEKCFLANQARKAQKYQAQFKVPDKRMWHIEVRALAKAGLWDELSKLVANKKLPPIGFEPFVEACIEHKNVVEAAKYIERLPEVHVRLEWLCQIGYWKEAAELAAHEKDVDALRVIHAKCRTPAVEALIDRILRTLQTK